MGPEVVNRNKDSIFHGDYAAHDLNVTNIIMFKDNEREFVVTHNANIKPVSYFIGRETELQELRQRIEKGRKSVLVSGMGGIGKTHICRKLFEEYLNKHAENGNRSFRHIGYIEYSGDMGSSLQNCLKYKQQDNPEQNLEAAWQELEYLASDGKLLLFVDNVNASVASDPGLERLKHIPGAIILTSRRTSFSREFEKYRIGFLDTEQCRKIYEGILFEDGGERVTKEEVPDLEYIIDKLAARHTITVELLAHLARTENWGAQRLRDELERNGFRLEYVDEDDKLINIQKSYEGLYNMSVLTEAEQNILEAFSVFPYIPLKAETCDQWLLADAGVNEKDYILSGLYRKGWLQFDMEQDSYALHPVFAQVIYEKCKPSAEMHPGLIEACQRCLEIPESGSPLVCQKYIAFAENMIEKLNMGENIKYVSFVSITAYLLYYVAEYEKSEKLYKKALQIRERELGEDHPSTATSYNNLASVYRSQGKYGEAEELYRKGLQIRERKLGEDHPSTAASYNGLAVAYEEQGKYREAEELYRKSVQIRERELGEDHLSTVMGYNNLASVYRSQGKYREAEGLYKKSLKIRERELGEGHPSTAASYNNLASVYRSQGKYGEAEGLYKKSLQISERVLGEGHPSTAASYNNLASVYRSQGKYGEAEELYRKGLQIRERVLGEGHPSTAASYNNLAGLYEEQGKYGKAEGLYKKSLQIQERVLGEGHLDTATSYNNLAGLYKEQGKYGEAEELYKKSLQICERVLEESHPSIATSYNNVAVVYKRRGDSEKALSYYLKAYKVFTFRLGKNHPNTQIVLKNMKIAYYEWNPEGNFEQWLEEKMKE